jgi:hypothetical protein
MQAPRDGDSGENPPSKEGVSRKNKESLQRMARVLASIFRTCDLLA